MFEDRREAGQKLGEALADYKHEKPVVLAIPRGGIEVGFWVAKSLQAPLSIVIVRKLPFPNDPESGFGAIAEDGSQFLFDPLTVWMDPDIIMTVIREQKQELERRTRVFRQVQSPPDIVDKLVILVDDGIAMGSTMQAAINYCRGKKAKKIVVAVPVAGSSNFKQFTDIVDDIVVLEQPPQFRCVAEVYRNWYDVGDDEAISILQNFK